VNVYVDSSVLLRIVLGEPGRLRGWRTINRPFSSELLRLECLRTIDRARIRSGLADDEVAERRAAILEHILDVRAHRLADRDLAEGCRTAAHVAAAGKR
jgi:predicted nucleic acid-binding protein